MKIYAIHDSKAAFYGPPFYARQNGEAIRIFTQAVTDPKSDFQKYPGDYTLFELGSYDDATGVISPIAPNSLGNGLEYTVAK